MRRGIVRKMYKRALKEIIKASDLEQVLKKYFL
jgi:hypothetical protein